MLLRGTPDVEERDHLEHSGEADDLSDSINLHPGSFYRIVWPIADWSQPPVSLSLASPILLLPPKPSRLDPSAVRLEIGAASRSCLDF